MRLRCVTMQAQALGRQRATVNLRRGELTDECHSPSRALVGDERPRASWGRLDYFGPLDAEHCPSCRAFPFYFDALAVEDNLHLVLVFFLSQVL